MDKQKILLEIKKNNNPLTQKFDSTFYSQKSWLQINIFIRNDEKVHLLVAEIYQNTRIGPIGHDKSIAATTTL